MANVRNTIQKGIILEAVQKLCDHPTAETVYTQVRQTHPRISKATVYRNLNQLAENGVICRLHLPQGADFYDCQTHPHYHMQCEECGGIYDLPLPYLEDFFAQVEGMEKFQIHQHNITFSGICPYCIQNSKNKGVKING